MHNRLSFALVLASIVLALALRSDSNASAVSYNYTTTQNAATSQVLCTESEIPTTGLVAHYPFSGNANDVSGNGNHGTVNGATLTIDRFGSPNQAYSFDGVNDYIQVADSPSLDIDQQISIAAWAKFYSNPDNSSRIVDKPHTSCASPWNMYGLRMCCGANQFAFDVTTAGSGHILNSVNSYSPNEWLFIVGTYDGSTQRIYVNSVLDTSAPISGSINTNNEPLLIGVHRACDSQYFDGVIDDIRIYNRALNTSEIEALYQEKAKSAYLTTIKTVSSEQVQIGDVLTYTVMLTNTTVAMPLTVSITDTLPTSLVYEANSLWATQGTPYYAAGTITWSDVISPGAMVTIGLRTQVIEGDTIIHNYVDVDIAEEGIYQSPACITLADPVYNFLPLVVDKHCTAPLEDDFSDPNSGWPVTETAAWRYKYEGGEYRMYAKQAEVFGAVSRGNWQQMAQLIVETDARQASTANGSMGIVFALTDDWSQFHTFEIYPATQQYAVFRFNGGSWSIVTSGTSSTIQSGQNTNRLRLVIDEYANTYSLYVNGTFLQARSLPYSFIGRRVGLTATSDKAGFDARFDNYKLVPEGCPENAPDVGLQYEIPPSFENLRDSKWSK